MRRVGIQMKHISQLILVFEYALIAIGGGAVIWQHVLKQPDQKKDIVAALQEPSPSAFELEKDDPLTIFSAYIEELPKNGVPLEYVKVLAAIPDKEGKPYLSPNDIKSIYESGLSAEDTEKLLHVQGAKGLPLFTATSLIKATKACKTIDDVFALTQGKDEQENSLLSDFEVYRSCQLGLTENALMTFQDTKKPNAVFVYPTFDYNEAFETQEAIALFHAFQETYDSKVVFASTEEDAYAAIQSVPNIEFLVLTGHGTATTLMFGTENYGEEKKYQEEKYQLDTGDSEIEDVLQKLSPHATIFLNSCSTGENERLGNNLANFITGFAGDRNVIAATEPFNQKELELISPYPVTIRIVRDITYNTNK